MADYLKNADTFCVRGVSKDGAPFAAAGFCEAGTGAKWQEAFRRFEEVPLSSASVYTVDLNLALSAANYKGSSLLLVAITAAVDREFTDGERTGGVIGEPGIEDESADGGEDRTTQGLPLVAFPGGPGIVADRDVEMARVRRAAEKLAERTRDITEKRLTRILEEAGVTGPVLVVFDGSGKHAQGAVYVRSAAGEKKMELL